jgi:hypothetical protein
VWCWEKVCRPVSVLQLTHGVQFYTPLSFSLKKKPFFFLCTMLLTKDEIQAITLNAKFVHKYADQVFFTSEVNNAAQRIGEQPFLNFFVRYHHRDAPERYTWSRVRRVLLLEDAIAAAQVSGVAPPATTATVDWRGKIVWVCLAVEAVESELHHTASHAAGASSAAASTEAKEELVMLSQLSNTVPTEEEILAFCVASANLRPTERYVDGVHGDATVMPPVLADPATSEPNGTTATETLEGVAVESPTSLNPRIFLPTARQVTLLQQYKKQHFTHHQWSEEEIEHSKALRQRYSSIGVAAAAPVRTVAFEQEHRVVERRQQRQQHQHSTAGGIVAPASPVRALLSEVEVTQDPLSGQASASDLTAAAGMAENGYAATQTQRSTVSATPQPPSSPSSATISDAPLSPFLPRSLLRHQQQQQQHLQQKPLDDSLPATPSFTQTLSPSQAQTQVAMGQGDEISTPSTSSLTALSQHLSQLRAAENSFFKYVSDEKRSQYLNRLASITLRNSQTNASNRRRGIANERRLERKGNLLESRGLWITDDKERAKQAEDYVKASVSGSADVQKEEGRAAKNAVVGSGAGEGSDTAKSAEDVFVEKFKAYHDAQQISFADCADDLLSGADADIELILKAAAAAAPANDSSEKNATNTANGASNIGRMNRRAARRLLPNRLNTEERSPLSVQAQLVHRSTLRMAKRVREE